MAMLVYQQKKAPVLSLAVIALLPSKPKVTVVPEGDAPAQLTLASGEVFTNDLNIARYLAAENPATNLYGEDAVSAAQINQWIDACRGVEEKPAFEALCAQINEHLTYRTFLVGYQISLADLAFWALVNQNPAGANLNKQAQRYPNLVRWVLYMESIRELKAVLAQAGLLRRGPPTAAANNNAAANKEAGAGNGKGGASSSSSGPNFEKLPNAVMGQVVTRFPPEPSGYLHIGHAKAAMLNHYYARHYQGKMLLRFDDTNPSKEKEEYVDNILADLGKLGITWDQLSYTSDYFPEFEKYCVQMIKEGKAYVDDTPVDKMREERMKGIESVHRNASVEQNLLLWEEMKNATPKGLTCCVRGKVDMQANNKCMRDPVFYRCNLIPHHRTGTKYKIYPTYDFACPIIDSLEGVTHALRTNEYADRIAQYYWVIDALRLRKPIIYEFSRLCFVNTLLSKRKLQWFVDSGNVESWADPRFPTVQGVLRRGLQVEALLEFILAQGPSKATNLMEWDKLWAMNKKVIDPIAPRYSAIAKEGAVPLHLEGAPVEPFHKVHPAHPKNEAVGIKVQQYSNVVLLEQDDAKMIEDNEELTLMRWGNCIITRITKDEHGTVTRLDGRLHLEGDFKTTKKKLTWVANLPEMLSPVRLVEYDHLISKKKLEEEDDFAQFITPQSKFETEALGDAFLKNLQKGQVIQLERRGYYIVDSVYRSAEHPVTLIFIPDGKTSAMSTLSTKVDRLASTKGTAVPAAK